MDFYWYPNCSTCKNAKKFLDQAGKEYHLIHIVENPPSEKQLAEMINKSGLPAKKFFNTSGKRYRELGLKNKLQDADEKEVIGWLASDGMLIKRPLAFDGVNVTVGFKKEVYEETWN